jgi:hypothetical protein
MATSTGTIPAIVNESPTTLHSLSSTSAASSSSATSTQVPITLSPSAALGIGFAAGVIATIVLLSATLFVYRCYKVRRSPAVQYYEQARLWKGFTPVTPNPNTARTTLVESKMANIYFDQIRSPAFAFSPPLSENGRHGTGTPRGRAADLGV